MAAKDVNSKTVSDIKIQNRNRIYQLLLANKELSQKQIADALNLSIPTVIQNIKELAALDLIAETGYTHSTGGRKAKIFSPNLKKHVSFGLDITQNHISVVLLDLAGNILRSIRSRIIYEDTNEFYENVYKIMLEMLASESLSMESILGLGISIPGIVDFNNRDITYTEIVKNLPAGEVLYDHARKYYHVPVSIINDASAAAIAEMWNHPSLDNMFYLMLSNSVGGSFYANGKAYYGNNNHSSEIGHTPLVPNGKPCFCGRKGCFDVYLNAKVLSDMTNGDLEKYFRYVEEGKEEYVTHFDSYISNLAVAVGNLHLLYDCTVILGGYVGGYMEPYIGKLQAIINKNYFFADKNNYVHPCSLHTESSAVGVALHYIKKFVDSV